MAKDAVLQVRIDPDLKRQAEQLYASMGTSLSEAVRMFVTASVEEQQLPFPLRMRAPKKVGSAYGMLSAFASPAKIGLERNAWVAGLSKKHES